MKSVYNLDSCILILFHLTYGQLITNSSNVLTGAGLRTRSIESKALIMSEVEKNVWPAIAEGKVKPVVYKSFPLSEAAEAHQLMESSKHIGKILLIA
ncbi:oxidoreductase, zinc-binding dehydrogenase family protein [Thalictrum thalictroides]|uniref:Oxidoreductase, zinc-binding dehydrogenase family protein n=1 Tax=Thalictrum thalictroides TaxID=46969 RepID=A0A7J6XAA8_THATH|nr:oxidoreductase, zinc-binding dehydrogenase family protein [Thalictrum thalictroides]